MESFGCVKEKLHVIHNSLDTNNQSTLFKNTNITELYKNHFNNSNKTIIFIGRVLEARKLDILVEALSNLKIEGYPLNCVIVGPVIEGGKLQAQIEKEALEKCFWFYGPCYEERINAELIYNAAVCVSPSYIGLTAIHSLSYGTPVIANNNFNSNGPELESIEHHVNGSLFEEGNVNSLANEIKYWVSISDTEREHVRSLARQRILDSWSVNYQIELIKRVLCIQSF